MINELLRNGFIELPEKNWRSGNTTYRRYKYNDMEVEYYKDDDECIVDIEDYPISDLLTYDDYSDKEWYKQWHGRYLYKGNHEEDVKDIIRRCNAFKEGMEKLVEEIKNRPRDDEKAIQDQLDKEVEMAQKVVDRCMQGNYLWNIKDDWEAKNLFEYIRDIKSDIEKIKAIDLSKETDRRLREYKHSLEKYGYIEIKNDDFYIKQVTERMDKVDKKKC